VIISYQHLRLLYRRTTVGMTYSTVSCFDVMPEILAIGTNEGVISMHLAW